MDLPPGARRWRALLAGPVLAQLPGAGPSRSLRPTNCCRCLSRALRRRRIPRQRRQRAPAASQPRAAERPAGDTARDLAGLRSHLSRAAGTYLADCEPVSLEGGGRKRTRGVGETERANTKAQLCSFPPSGDFRADPILPPEAGGEGSVGTVGVKAGAPDRSAHRLLLAGH